MDRDAVDAAAPELGSVVEKGGDAVTAGQAQGGGELGTGGTGSVDRHADAALADAVLQLEQGIAQGKPHGAGEAREQEPQQEPAAARGQWQLQHHPCHR